MAVAGNWKSGNQWKSDQYDFCFDHRCADGYRHNHRCEHHDKCDVLQQSDGDRPTEFPRGGQHDVNFFTGEYQFHSCSFADCDSDHAGLENSVVSGLTLAASTADLLVNAEIGSVVLGKATTAFLNSRPSAYHLGIDAPGKCCRGNFERWSNRRIIVR